jgi:hypothetical protein
MTLFESPPYDPSATRRKWMWISGILCGLIVVVVLGWMLRFWPEERVVEHFFEALQQQKYEAAYGIWMQDPDWKRHPDQYARYPYQDFLKDWGPSGEWGVIKTYHVDGAAVPKGYSGSPFAVASGVVVVVTVNGRVDKAHLWVQKDDDTLGFSPY